MKHSSAMRRAMLKDLLHEIVSAIVDEPEAIRIEEVSQEESTVLRLYVAPRDVGKVIGKQGNMAHSMRAILSAAGKKLNHHHALDIVVMQPTDN